MNGKQILGAIVAIWFLLYMGTCGADTDDFVEKYAKKHDLYYRNIRTGVLAEDDMFIVPTVEFTKRYDDGSKEVLGSFWLWMYHVK